MKKKRVIGILVLSIFMVMGTSAHSGKPKYHVIVDTDGAIDDMRAISMLLSGNDIRVLAITCSQGTLLPDTVYTKVYSLLSAFHHEGIPLGLSTQTDFELPDWESFASDINWGKAVQEEKPGCQVRSTEVLNRAIEDYRSKVTLIALGSLKTYADWLKANSSAAEKIDRIIWYNNHNIKEGFNYKVSPESYDYIMQCGILLEIVANNSDDLLVSSEYLDLVGSSGSVYGKQIEDVHTQPKVIERINDKHLHLWDDIVPLYLTIPLLFDVETADNIKFTSINPQLPSAMVYEMIHRLLKSANATNNRVFSSFPVDTTLYKPEYARILTETIERFGPVEWKAICMTNEIHGHTGIYSIIGAKMGIRAIEYFNVGVNNLNVITFAGNTPPLSCFNDGLQISSGATIGQGLITVSDSISSTPLVIFEFNKQKVRISLKQEFAEKMRNEIAYGVSNYGLLSDTYWLYIERLAIDYWEGFDRHEIFLIERL